MRAAIIDNERNVRHTLKALLKAHCPFIQLIGEADGCVSGRELIIKEQPELIFLDIEMNDGSGVDLVKNNRNFQGHIIFITAHDKYAVDAFKCSALDFLLKPIDHEDLIRSVNRAKTQMKNLDLQQRVKVLESYMSFHESSGAKLVLSDSESMHIVNMSDIVWCCAEGSYTRFMIDDGVEILVSKNLKYYEDLLNEDHFVRVHHSYLVNINHIKRFERSEGGILIMNNGGVLPVSVRKKDNLMQILKGWNFTHL